RSVSPRPGRSLPSPTLAPDAAVRRQQQYRNMTEDAHRTHANGRPGHGPRWRKGAVQPAETSPMKRRINPRFLILALAILAVSAVGVHLLHGFQVRRNAAALLREADRHEQEGDEAKALEYLARYVGLRPDDNEAYCRYALLLDKLAKTPRARVQA